MGYFTTANFPLTPVVHQGLSFDGRDSCIVCDACWRRIAGSPLTLGAKEQPLPGAKGRSRVGGSPCRRRVFPCTVATGLQRRSLAGPGIAGAVATRCRLPSLVAITSPLRPSPSLLPPFPPPSFSFFLLRCPFTLNASPWPSPPLCRCLRTRD